MSKKVPKIKKQVVAAKGDTKKIKGGCGCTSNIKGPSEAVPKTKIC